ncbi:glycosyltransferase 87 family protein [Pengzhenrongella phosphoraccumulans]|uniref:glycosyltransferase 87 family protein n=1 Tax=Pengzhenrongella phosphoraccumulans TaxID=3114394 RepID=UPI00388F08C6
MTLEPPRTAPVARIAASRRALWVAFVLAHAWLAFIGTVWIPHRAFYDVDLYRYWTALGLENNVWPVFDGPWVYPVGALLPMLLPAAISTTSTLGYALAWSALVTAGDAVAVWALSRSRHAPGAWWWLAFLVLLGPVAMGRIDAILAPIVILALLVAMERPRVAAALLTVGAWIKVAPGVLILPLLLIVRRPVRDVVVPAALVCAGVVGAVAVGGGLGNVASFLSQQDARGLQVEAVVSTPWVVASLVRDDVVIGLNHELITWEIVGPGTSGAARLMDVLLPLAVAALAVLLWRARSRPLDVLVWGSLAFATLLIVVNKVGSPQYVGWLAPPVAVALALRSTWPDDAVGARSRAAVPRVAGAVLLIAALTQLIFPLAYNSLLSGGVLISGVLVVRNLLLLALLVAMGTLLATDGTRRGADVPDGGLVS